MDGLSMARLKTACQSSMLSKNGVTKRNKSLLKATKVAHDHESSAMDRVADVVKTAMRKEHKLVREREEVPA